MYEEETSHLRFSVIGSVIQKCLNFKLLPNIKNVLDLHENFTTITRLQREHNPTNFIENKPWMVIQASTVVDIKIQFGELKLNP